jgi:hypothetical protein
MEICEYQDAFCTVWKEESIPHQTQRASEKVSVDTRAFARSLIQLQIEVAADHQAEHNASLHEITLPIAQAPSIGLLHPPKQDQIHE